MTIRKLGGTLNDDLGYVDDDDKPQFYHMLFETQWVTKITYIQNAYSPS